MILDHGLVSWSPMLGSEMTKGKKEMKKKLYIISVHSVLFFFIKELPDAHISFLKN